MTAHINTNSHCSHCKRNFDAKKAILAFPGNITGKKVSLVFALCPDCYDVFILADKKLKSEIIKLATPT